MKLELKTQLLLLTISAFMENMNTIYVFKRIVNIKGAFNNKFCKLKRIIAR